jgi:hypothetical protein
MHACLGLDQDHTQHMHVVNCVMHAHLDARSIPTCSFLGSFHEYAWMILPGSPLQKLGMPQFSLCEKRKKKNPLLLQLPPMQVVNIRIWAPPM